MFTLFTPRVIHGTVSQSMDPSQLTTCSESALKNRKFTIKLFAPLEIENLLPYNIEYTIFDKNSNKNWSSFLREGGIMPAHCVDLSHLVLLNAKVHDAGKWQGLLPDQGVA